MIKYGFLIIFLCFLACNASEVNQNDSNQEQALAFLSANPQINKALDSLVENDLVPFVYARIEGQSGEMLYEYSTVNDSLYPGLEVNKDSWFRLWSMSKIITISLAMDLVEDGIISLDDEVRQYIPEFSELKVAQLPDSTYPAQVAWEDAANTPCPTALVPVSKQMTIADLINHKAGFYYPWTNIQCLDSIWIEMDLNSAKNSEELINLLKTMPLMQEPGTTYHYGLNTTVLGMVAEKATGKPLKQLVAERITEPMNIPDLQYSKPNDVTLLPRTSGGDSLIKITPENESQILGAELPKYEPEHQLYLGGEGMLGTTDGYADFARMLLHNGALNGHRLLEESTIKEMSSPHTQLDNPWGYNGYNLWVTGDTLEIMRTGEAGLWVGGGYEGTYFWIDRKRDFVALVMTQMFNMKTAPSDVFRAAVYREIWKQESEKIN
jgi:CubicO group peptidase (beta-lactamase class C family)